MTCIVAIRTQEGVHMGADSAGVDGLGFSVSRKDPKIYRLTDEMIAGFTTSFRFGQLIGMDLQMPCLAKDLDEFRYMVHVFVPALRDCLRQGGYSRIRENEETGGTCLVGLRNRLFYIGSNFQVDEPAEDYAAVGCGQDIAMGALYATNAAKSSLPRINLTLALNAAQAHSSGVREPFIYDFSMRQPAP